MLTIWYFRAINYYMIKMIINTLSLPEVWWKQNVWQVKEACYCPKSPGAASRSKEPPEHPLPARLWASHTGEWRLPRGADLPHCPPGWQTALNPNYDPSQSWTNHKPRCYLLEDHQVDWFHGFAASEPCHTHREGLSAWKPRGRNPSECGECKGRSELDYRKAVDAKLWYGHSSTAFPQFAMALFTASVALTQIWIIDRKSHGRPNDTLSLLCTWVNRYALEFVTGNVIQNVIRKRNLEKSKGR